MLYNSFMPEWIGKTIGKVRVDKELAKGGMAEVYLGMHVTLDRPVAIKVMHNYIESDPDLQSRFEREAKVVAALRHPNIVQIFDFDTAEGHPYIVADGFTHVRHLLFSFNATPKQIGFMRGLDADTTLLNESGQQMLASFETGDETDLDFQVERMLNVIVGSQSEDYKDWNADGNSEWD